jgi:hypothetical protein
MFCFLFWVLAFKTWKGKYDNDIDICADGPKIIRSSAAGFMHVEIWVKKVV